MLLRRTALPLALTAGVAFGAPLAAAEAKPAGPVAHAAGSGAAAVDPPIVGIPIARTQTALFNAMDAIDSGQGADAVGPLRASRRYLLRSYRGAKYLIANQPPPAPAGDGSARAKTFMKMARRSVRASRHGRITKGRWIRAEASGAEGGGPGFADGPTAVFDVLTSQFNAATTAVAMLPDVEGKLLGRVQTTLNTAIVLRNRIVQIVHAAEPPAPPVGDGRVRAQASDADAAPTFGAMMPGLLVLLDAEAEQMQAMAADSTVPQASRDVLNNPLAADKQIGDLVNQYWPPVVDD